MSKNIAIIIDIGTSYIKCYCINSDHKILTSHQKKFPMIEVHDSYELDFQLFLRTTKGLIFKCLQDTNIKGSGIEALLITSQANTFVPVNYDFEPLCNGIVWLDERAVKEAGYLNCELPDYSKYSGFKQIHPSLYAAKLLWLKRNEASIYKKAAHFPLINEYIVYKLTGHYYSDTTSFGMSGMYDHIENEPILKLLQILELTGNHFPMIEDPAKRGELISIDFMKELELDHRFPVYLCGNDQGASAIGAGLRDPGDININFGTAMVLYTITQKLSNKLNNQQIAGKHPVGDYYFLLNYEADFGIQIRWLKDYFFREGTYDQLFKTYLDYPSTAEKVPFSKADDLNLISSSESPQYCAGIIKYYLNRLKRHLSQIKKSIKINNVFISGGMAQSTVWLEILNNTLNMPITENREKHAGILGAYGIYQQFKIKKD